jgi:hypothetical protein
MEQAGKSVTQTTTLGDYRAVKVVKVPYNMIQNVGFELEYKISEVKIVEELQITDFKMVYTILNENGFGSIHSHFYFIKSTTIEVILFFC